MDYEVVEWLLIIQEAVFWFETWISYILENILIRVRKKLGKKLVYIKSTRSSPINVYILNS
jgi:hypothetical protein